MFIYIGENSIGHAAYEKMLYADWMSVHKIEVGDRRNCRDRLSVSVINGMSYMMAKMFSFSYNFYLSGTIMN